MKIKKHLLNLAVTRTSHTLDPLNEYIRYIINFVGSEELVNFSFEAMLNDVDFEQAEHAKWSDVSPDFSFIQFKNLGGQHVKISLGANLRLLFKEAQKNRTSDLIFENQYSLVIRIGAIILLTTGLAASDLKYLNEQSNDIDKQESTENTVKQTRLCLEPWGNYSVGLKGEVVA